MSNLTHHGLAVHARQMLGHPYWYGGKCQKPTESLLAQLAARYPAHYGSGRMARYRKDIADGKRVTDCSGLITGYVAELKTNANGMYSRATVKGGISALPEVAGLLVWRDGHIGVYEGNGLTIEARGFEHHGIVQTRVSARGWDAWFECPYIDYMSEGGAPDQPVTRPTLRKGSKGADVKTMQHLLITKGYPLPHFGADGNFGDETEAVVRKYQAAHGLVADGVVGARTWTALLDHVIGDDPDAADGGATGDALTVSGTYYLRTGPGTQYAKAGVARDGDKLTAVEGAGWVPIELDGAVRWISRKAIREDV